MTADNASGAPAPLARLRGISGWQTGVIQSDGQRWVTFTLEWLDGAEPIAVTFDPRDAELIGRTLVRYAETAAMADMADRN
jgi:hypothetical protein